MAGQAYLCGRRKANFEAGPRGEGDTVESLMLESDDGLIWRKRAVFQEVKGDETAFQFESDGSIIAIGRRGGRTPNSCAAARLTSSGIGRISTDISAVR